MTDLAPVLNSILSAAASALNDAGAGAGLVHLAPGSSVAWDNCCEGGGQLWLRVLEIYPTAGLSSPFPSRDSSQPGGCGVVQLAVHLGLGIVRCTPTLDDHGNPPSGEAMTGSALEMVDDMRVLLEVVACAVKTLPGVANAKVGRWVPQGPDGGCAGGEWTFHIAYDPCTCRE